jgi:hypothetical protein
LAIVDDYAVVIAGVAALLADHRIDVVETEASLPVVSDVDIVLYDTFGQVQGDGLDLEDFVRDSGAKVVIYSWNLQPELVDRAVLGEDLHPIGVPQGRRAATLPGGALGRGTRLPAGHRALRRSRPAPSRLTPADTGGAYRARNLAPGANHTGRCRV